MRFSTEGANDSAAEPIDVVASSVDATRVVVRAPSLSLAEGDVTHSRGFPCWNPPCRRTVVTLAINGIDFVGRPKPLVFYFFEEPWRFLGLMATELVSAIVILLGLSLANAILTWNYRFDVYERYLKLKYRFKNRVLFPLLYRDRIRDRI